MEGEVAIEAGWLVAAVFCSSVRFVVGSVHTGQEAVVQRGKEIFRAYCVVALIEGREQIVQHGSREMPIWHTWFAGEQISSDASLWADLTRGRVWQFIVYLESLQVDGWSRRLLSGAATSAHRLPEHEFHHHP